METYGDAGGSAILTLVGGSGVLAAQPPKVRRLAVDSLTERGIRTAEEVSGRDEEFRRTVLDTLETLGRTCVR